MKKNPNTVQLTQLASKLKFGNQHLLRAVEDELVGDRVVTLLKREDLDKATKRFLALSSLPWAWDKMPKVKLDELWSPCACSYNGYLVLPTGCMQPKIMVCGDAPGYGVTDVEYRQWVAGTSSHALRKALYVAGLYLDTWFTNLLRHPTPGNRPTTDEEVDLCGPSLLNEVNQLKPEYLLVCGNRTEEAIRRVTGFSVGIVKILHPAYVVRQGWDTDQYARHIEGRIRDARMHGLI